jgi:uncharacterized membrane protein
MTNRTARALRRSGAIAVGALLLSTGLAYADLRICNRTGNRIGVSLGYKDDRGWATEGWWNVSAQSCETLLKGPLITRYYYIHAVDYDEGGEWVGTAFMCTQDRMFTIRGIDDCARRGYSRTGFFEVDTGEERNWTVQLVEPSEMGQGGQ